MRSERSLRRRACGVLATRLATRLAAATLLAGCVTESVLAPEPTVLVVHAVLDPSRSEQVVVVERALTGGARIDSAAGLRLFNTTVRPVPGARVTITTPDGRELVGEEVRDTALVVQLRDTIRYLRGVSYRVRLDRYGVTLVPGGTYALRVVGPTGEEVTGTTTLPRAGAPPAAQPTERINRDHDSLLVRWEAVPGARRYEVVVRSAGLRTSVFADSTAVFGDSSLVPGLRHDAIVAAVDANYYDYARTRNDPLTGSGIVSRLRGGIGVFGAWVPVQRRVIDVDGDTDEPFEGRYVLQPQRSDSGAAIAELTLYLGGRRGASRTERHIGGRYRLAGSAREFELSGFTQHFDGGMYVGLTLFGDPAAGEPVKSLGGTWIGGTIDGTLLTSLFGPGRSLQVVYRK